MAVGLVFDGVGVNQAQYEQVLNQVSPDNQAPSGLVYHAAGPTEGGFCVVEIWESEEALQQFFVSLGPALQQAGINVQPKMFQVVNTIQP
jgi:hypothetical protein